MYISSDEQAFSDASPLYVKALKEGGHSEGLQYLAHRKTEVKDSKRTGQRNVIWFNPPYSRNVKTTIGYNFLKLVDKHFSKGSTLHKIFNRNNLKVRYSCKQNVATIISQHNNKVRRNQQQDRSDRGETRKCNCRIKDQCPLEGEWMLHRVRCLKGSRHVWQWSKDIHWTDCKLHSNNGIITINNQWDPRNMRRQQSYRSTFGPWKMRKPSTTTNGKYTRELRLILVSLEGATVALLKNWPFSKSTKLAPSTKGPNSSPSVDMKTGSICPTF